jgi:cell division protein FtsB
MAGREADRTGRARRGAAAASRPDGGRAEHSPAPRRGPTPSPRARPSSPNRSRAVRSAAGRRRRGAAFGLSTTRRAAVFAIVVCALALSIAVPLRTYLSQRADVEVQQQREAELRAQVDSLEQRQAELADPAQVEAEARRRLRYVMPGETPYMVELPGDQGGPGQGQSAPEPVPQQSWYQLLWNGVSATSGG